MVCSTIVSGKESNSSEIGRLDAAITKAKEAKAKEILIEKSEKRAKTLHAEVELAVAMEEPVQSAVVDEEGNILSNLYPNPTPNANPNPNELYYNFKKVNQLKMLYGIDLIMVQCLNQMYKDKN